MNVPLRIKASAKAIVLIVLFVFAEILVGMATVYLPRYWITLLLGLVVFVLVTSYPMIGVSLMLISLYFPLLPTVPLGPVEFSASTLPAVGLVLGTFFRSRFRGDRIHLAGWQQALIVMLGLVFFLSTLFSTDYLSSFKMVPNMVIYLLILFGIMAEVNTAAKLQYVAKVILVLAFLLSIWRVELRPLRGLLGLPSLGINGAVFNFHPAVALSCAILLFMPDSVFSPRWRWFTGITLGSLLIHGVQYETRAAWVTWAVLLVVLLSRVYWERWLRFIPVFVVVLAISAAIYGSRIQFNYLETVSTVQASFGGNYVAVSSDDRVRLLARDAGWRMFQTRPIFGLGANRFDFVKPKFVSESSKEADYPGAFNSWLIMLAEMGLVGVAAGLLISLTPLVATWYLLPKRNDALAPLAFGFALGALGLAIHLLFIDLMFSFYWVHIALALTGMRLALEGDVVFERAPI